MADKKPVSHKDLRTVDYKKGEPEQHKWNAKKRKRADVEEALSLQSRRALSRAMKRNKAKIKLGRKRAEKRTATMDVIRKRARKHARNQVLKKITKGKGRSDLTPARRAEIEKRMKKYSGRIDKMARKLMPTIRKLDKSRKMKNTGDKK